MIRVSDFIFRHLADYGVKHVFLVVGGGAMHLNDALKKETRIQYICNHHEQGSAIAAEGYARISGKLAVVSVTTGPGGTNALTGVIGQWLDSVPVLYLSGQVKFETTIASVPGSGLRQLGDQEINIVDIVRPVTKYAKMVTDPQSIKIELERAIHLATTGRPGPVWLDIPLDVQAALIDPDRLPVEIRESVAEEVPVAKIAEVVERLKMAKRPLIVAGHGIRIAGAQKAFLDLVTRLGIPVVTTFNGFDLIASDDSQFIGRIGTLGNRAGNFALQNADVVLFLGTRNNIRQVSYFWNCFARKAWKVIVDIDEAELHKPTVQGDSLIRMDAGLFLAELDRLLPPDLYVDKLWLEWCVVRKRKYPTVLEEYKKPSPSAVHPYVFFEQLTDKLDDRAIVVAGNGTACVVLFQAGVVKTGQRQFWNSGCAAMGYDLPAAIGASLASGHEVICLAGDGSLQMNLQELQTMKEYRLPIKLFILNNGGYRSIEQTQTSFFQADFIGCNESSGVSLPNCAKLADLYGFPFFRIQSTETMDQDLTNILNFPGAALIEIVLNREYIFSPKVSSEKQADGKLVSKPLEDLFPFLDRDEFRSNMIVDDLVQEKG
ncbi:MAG TPA: thiamine pyrophosphate-binding protein [Candidatus Ozemobacteraceae bacterium]|nr:thiamine pyrophosphate-binding protein [Candidatus Ozemobacteraceae bacterium]